MLPEPLTRSSDQLEKGERYLQGALVENVWTEPRDRIIRLRLIRKDRTGKPTYGQLIFELIGSYHQAALIREQNLEVLARWGGRRSEKRQPRVEVGKTYLMPSQDRLLPTREDRVNFIDRLDKGEGPVAEWFSRTIVGMDKHTARELCFRAGIQATDPLSSIDAPVAEKLWTLAAALYDSQAADAGYVWLENSTHFFSALEPTSRGEGNYDAVFSVSEAIRLAHRPAGGPSEASRLAYSRLEKARIRVSKRLEAMRRDLEEASTAVGLEKMGSALLAQLGKVCPGAIVAELQDVFDPARGNIKIELDPSRTPAENAESLLKRAGRFRRRMKRLPARIEETERLLGEITEKMNNRNQDARDREESEWLERRGLLDRRGSKGNKLDKGQAHPRRYKTSQGWQVLVGRNNKENDQLTHRVAAQNDIWFHAYGYAGAHVVLRREDHKNEPGVRNLEEAAAIAAYWSKGRTAKKVAVVYTLVKYVSKSRGAAPGKATLRREKTIMAILMLPRDGAE